MYDYSQSPILPIGMVNLLTGANKMFGSVWNCWSEGEGTYLLVQDQYTGKYRAISTSDTLESASKYYPAGRTMQFCHDQTRAQIGNSWTVIGLFPNTKAGLKAMAAKCSKKSLPFSCFK